MGSLCIRYQIDGVWPETELQTQGDSVRLWRMDGDCAANRIKFNGNDVMDYFVINFILQNNEW